MTTPTPQPRKTKRRRANSKNLDLIIEGVIKGVDSTLDSKLASRFNSQIDPENGCLDVEFLIEKIVERIMPKLDALIDAKLQRLGLGLGPTTQPIDNRLIAGQRHFGQPPFYSQQQQQVNFSSLTKFIHSSIINQESIVNKSKRAVIEKFPEDKDASEFIKAVAEGCGVGDMLEEDIHRHPRTQRTNGNKDDNKNSRPRIIKIPFKTMEARDKFLKNFTSVVRNSKNSLFGIKVRRDMTQSELQILYSLRREAYERNKAEKLFKFVVHDLSLYELKNPKPLKSNYH